MHPAFSVIFLTTLIGAGQGLFLALYLADVLASLGILPVQEPMFFVRSSLIALGLLVAGLAASFFHLGHPERAWRSASQWRTSWLSREVIALPALMAVIAAYAGVHYLRANPELAAAYPMPGSGWTLSIGAAGVVATLVLFVCTGMIYACIKFIREWASALTILNFVLLGTASGFTLAAALAALLPTVGLVGVYAWTAVVLTLIALLTRSAALVRNSRLKPKSTNQTAIGIRHGRILQRSQGAMGGSFNTREFFHGAPNWLFRSVRHLFLVLAFAVPVVLLLVGTTLAVERLLAVAFVVQYLGLIAERWFFFAQANHPQNLYYQHIG